MDQSSCLKDQDLVPLPDWHNTFICSLIWLSPLKVIGCTFGTRCPSQELEGEIAKASELEKKQEELEALATLGRCTQIPFCPSRRVVYDMLHSCCKYVEVLVDFGKYPMQFMHPYSPPNNMLLHQGTQSIQLLQQSLLLHPSPWRRIFHHFSVFATMVGWSIVMVACLVSCNLSCPAAQSWLSTPTWLYIVMINRPFFVITVIGDDMIPVNHITCSWHRAHLTKGIHTVWCKNWLSSKCLLVDLYFASSERSMTV